MTDDGHPSDQTSTTGTRSPIVGWIREHRRTSAIVAGALAFVVLGGGAVAAGAASGRSTASAPAPSAASSRAAAPSAAPRATPTPTPTVAARPTPSAIAAPAPLRTCSVAAQAADSRLGTFEGTVLDASTGETVFDRNGSTPARTGSVMKTLTSAVALSVLGPDYRFTTRVVGTGGSISLVGGGDPTLSTLPAGSESVYPGAPKIRDLATQVKAKLGSTPLTSIQLDSSFWNNADSYDASWPVSERTIGYQPLIVPLMIDGDRANPQAATSPRSTDPVGRAGDAFRQALVSAGVTGASTAAITRGTATSTAVLGEVRSQPVSTLIGQMIPNSDNTLAEMLARVSSKVSGSDGSAASLTAVYKAALSKGYGLDASTITIIDGSGESLNDGVPSAVVSQLMIKVMNRVGSLGILYDTLPVAGQSGTLASRFTGANAVARGHVHAKTGWIDSAYTLGGVIDAQDGTKLTFAFYAIGNVSGSARQALDTLTAAVYSCGANLSNN
ncbi:D-alanyl-D-alanine carboxypeptidase DacC [Frondihabitans sp. 762G35]|uniref:D-alanyl-D-alanine carboxypeptidase/D-alanyl-D-alanine endopeptidase n=1 Tax=Frondihabitans sp. 762G35 TaxID=1446794 RepID=UPI000D222C8E|nr:D-alanyl-D-alanine carboxypeptidase/D-alanyl-D-alanine-endopeptidase [Frondihabitans sp. 762G35]ARC57500.1 D-alanyl-D-alanine carboxypeptidase DacC [Frondihabitans sp. 762G35]